MEGKKRYITPISFGVATVWFSTHCGAGFASGTQELQFFSNHGWYGPFMPIITFIIIALTYYVGLETARQTDKWSYDQWSKEAYGKYAKIFTPALELSIIVLTIAASAATIATGGLLGQEYLGLPVLVGSVAMVLLVTLLVIFGESMVRKSSMVITFTIIGIISILILAGLIKFAPDLSRLFSEGYVNPKAAKWGVESNAGSVHGNIINSLLWALTYAGFQIPVIGGLTASFRGGVHNEEAKGAMIVGALMNIVMLVGVCLLIFSQMPFIYEDPTASLLPTVYIVKKLGIPILEVMYPILLFLALVTTAVGVIFGIVTRFESRVLKGMENMVLKRAIIAIGSLVICYLVSTLGLMWVIKTAYKYLGIFNWFLVILPLWILGYKNIKKRRQGLSS